MFLPTDKDLELLFQPMFDEYFEVTRIDAPVPSATAVNAHAIPPGTSVSTTFAQDAPSIISNQKTVSSELYCAVSNRTVKTGTKEFQMVVIEVLLFNHVKMKFTSFDRLEVGEISTSPSLCNGYRSQVDLQGFAQEEEDAYVTLTPILDTQKSGGPTQSSSVSSDFTSKLLNLDNPSLADNEIASLMVTIAHHATVIPEITSKTTTSFPALPDFAYVFKFNERVFNLEKDLSKIKQVDQYAQALSSIPAIVDHYMDNKLGEAINKAIQAHNLDCRQEAQDEKNAYIELVDTSMRALIKEEKNVTKSVEAVVLTRSLSQLTSTYEAAASLSEFELTKILIDKMEKNKSYDKADYKKKLYDALVKSYNTDKDLFDSYGEVFSLKRSRDEDKDRVPSAGSDRGKKRRKLSKDVESSRDSRSKEKKSSNTSKEASQSQHKSSGKFVHAEEPSHTVEDSGMQQDQEFVTGDNDEQPANKEVTKADWFKKPERPPTPDPDWSKRQHVDFRPPQTWISQVAHAEEPPTSFDELNDTSFDFFAFVMNQLKIPNLTQEILVGPAFNLLKGTCKSIIELEYHLEECSKATTERLDWHNPENKPYPFDLRKPLLLIQDHRGRQIIPKDYFINKDLEYLKNGDLSRKYSTSVTKTKAATYELKWIEDLGPKRQRFYGYASNLTSSKDVYSRRRIIAVTRLKIMKKYDYGHLEEIEVRRDDQKLYTFKEGDFKRLRLQDIEDMLLLLVQQKLTNLTIDERYDLNVALRMYTRRIVIQRRVEDLQLGVKSYQKKLNLTKPDTYRSNLKNRTAYTSYSDPHGIIYVDQNRRKRLMRADELHKFSDGTLNDVRSALHDIAAGIRMEYLPMRKWSNLDKKRARVMVQDIDKQLYQRRLMRNLEKFVGGREYENDLRLLERTI
ncbi:hypothetical protein Tco_0968030 [Tanacetum coccineum]